MFSSRFLLSLSLLVLLQSSLLAQNLKVHLSRAMVNQFTDFLSSSHDAVDSVLFDLVDEKFVLKVFLRKTKVPGMDWVKPTLRPGEIFKPSEERDGSVTVSEEEDFLIGFALEFELSTKPEDLDAVFLSFEQPRVAAFYGSDLAQFRIYQKELTTMQAGYNSLLERKSTIVKELEGLTRSEIRKKLLLTRARAQIQQEVDGMQERLLVLTRYVTRFHSGSHFSVLPSDAVLTDLVRSAGGVVNGDSIMNDVYETVQGLDVLSDSLGVQLIGGKIENRSGTVRVFNISKPLAPFVPGILFESVKVVGIDEVYPHTVTDSAQEESGNYFLEFVAKARESVRGGQQ